MHKYFLLTVFCILLCINVAPGSNVYSDKRGRPQYSSLIPFPRVGRSPDHAAPRGGMGNMWYYGQKRGGKSGLIPFPRVGRSGANTWDLDLDDAPAEGLVEFESIPTKRQSLIPFPRVGKRGSVFSRRILRSNGWKPLRSNDFKRRITRSYWDKSELRGEGFKRRITRSVHGPQRLMKRQSLIPFPRTGKRSVGFGNKEQNQIYMFENEEDDEDGVEDNIDYYDEDLGRDLIVNLSTLELSVHNLNCLQHKENVQINTSRHPIMYIDLITYVST